ncbi:MAG: DUF3352 domain-containing protein [Solirubrobacteraceae bacterium]
MPRVPELRRVRSTPRAVLALGVPLFALLALALVLVLALAARGGGQGPATGAAQLVPADALLYLHVSTDGARRAVRRALSVAARFPDLPLAEAAVQSRLAALSAGSSTVDFGRQIRPWLGREAAFALLNTTSSTAGSLVVLDVRDERAARAFVTGFGAVAAGRDRGVSLLRYRGGAELAFVSHYLLLGQSESVRAAIAVARGSAPSLGLSAAYRAAVAGEPDDRVLDGYVSAAGLRRVLQPRHGVLGALGSLLDGPALTGVGASLSSDTGGVRLRIHSVVDPALARLSGHRSQAFTPTLQAVVPAGATLALLVRGLARAAPPILAAGASAGVAGGVGQLLRRLGGALTAEGVDVAQLEALFGGQTAVVITSSPQKLALLIITHVTDAENARTQLAALQAPLAQLFPPAAQGPGATALSSDVQVAGQDVHQQRLEPGLELDYAVAGQLLLVSTGLPAIESALHHPRALGSSREYRAVASSRSGQVSSLLFLDFSQLLSLGEQTGLMRGARFQALRADLQRIRAVGLQSTSGEADSTAELFLQIS